MTLWSPKFKLVGLCMDTFLKCNSLKQNILFLPNFPTGPYALNAELDFYMAGTKNAKNINFCFSYYQKIAKVEKKHFHQIKPWFFRHSKHYYNIYCITGPITVLLSTHDLQDTDQNFIQVWSGTSLLFQSLILVICAEVNFWIVLVNKGILENVYSRQHVGLSQTPQPDQFDF